MFRFLNLSKYIINKKMCTSYYYTFFIFFNISAYLILPFQVTYEVSACRAVFSFWVKCIGILMHMNMYAVDAVPGMDRERDGQTDRSCRRRISTLLFAQLMQLLASADVVAAHVVVVIFVTLLIYIYITFFQLVLLHNAHQTRLLQIALHFDAF